MDSLQDPRYIQLHKTEIYDFIFVKKIGTDLKQNPVFEGVDKFREHKAVKFIDVPEIVKLKHYLDEPLTYGGSNCQYVQGIKDITVMNGFRNVMTVMDLPKMTLSDLITDSDFLLDERFEVIKQIGLGIQYLHLQKKSAIKILRPQSIFCIEDKDLQPETGYQKRTRKIKIGPYADISKLQEFMREIKEKKNEQRANIEEQQHKEQINSYKVPEQWLFLYDAPEISHDQRYENSRYENFLMEDRVPRHLQYNANYREEQTFNAQKNLNFLAQKAVNPRNFYNDFQRIRGENPLNPNRNFNTYSKKSDIWVFGVIIIEILLGKSFKDILLELNTQSDPNFREREDFSKLLLKDFPEKQNHQDNHLRQLLLNMLQCNPHKRPSIGQIMKMLDFCQHEVESSPYLDNNLFNNLNISKLRRHTNTIQIKQCLKCKDQTNLQCDDPNHQFNCFLNDDNFVLPPISLKQDCFDHFMQTGREWQNLSVNQKQQKKVKTKMDLFVKKDLIKLQKKQAGLDAVMETEKGEQNYQKMQNTGIYSSKQQFYPIRQNDGSVPKVMRRIDPDILPESLDYHKLIIQKISQKNQFLKYWHRLSSKSQSSSVLNLRFMKIKNQLPRPLIPNNPKIQSLYLSHNSIESLSIFNDYPFNISPKFFNLKLLDLSYNKITELKGIENIPSLEELYLQQNSITLEISQTISTDMEIQENQHNVKEPKNKYSIPIQNMLVLSSLKSMKYLVLSHNRIRLASTGGEIGPIQFLLENLKQLQSIDLRSNLMGGEEKRQLFEESLGKVASEKLMIIID